MHCRESPMLLMSAFCFFRTHKYTHIHAQTHTYTHTHTHTHYLTFSSFPSPSLSLSFSLSLSHTQLMGWFNAGSDQKVEAPDLFGCVQLPLPAACFGLSESLYGVKQREALLAHLREEKAQSMPWWVLVLSLVFIYFYSYFFLILFIFIHIFHFYLFLFIFCRPQILKACFSSAHLTARVDGRSLLG